MVIPGDPWSQEGSTSKSVVGAQDGDASHETDLQRVIEEQEQVWTNCVHESTARKCDLGSSCWLKWAKWAVRSSLFESSVDLDLT